MNARAETVSPAVRNVHTITTGYGEQHREHRYGTTKPTLWWVLTSKSWVRIPLNAYAIEHRDGLVLFDTGVNPSLVTDPNYINSPIGRFLLRRIFRFDISEDDTLGQRLEDLGFAARDVRKVAISHMHFDHIGGISEVPQADLFVSRDEWQQLELPHPERDWILREHVDLPGAKWRPIDFEPTDDPQLSAFGRAYDMMGDGSLTLLPTPGHTRGSMSMLIRSDGMPPLLLVGDLTYELDLLLNDQVPGIGDPDQLKQSFAKVRALKKALPDLVILPSHDEAADATLVAALEDSRRSVAA